MKVLLIVGKAISLKNVGRDIAYVLMVRGHVPRFVDYIVSLTYLDTGYDSFIFFYPASPLFSSPYMLLYRDCKVLLRKPCIFYTTIEGIPRRALIRGWMLRDVDFIANSRYTYEKLTDAGFEVSSIVYHGLLKRDVYGAEKMVGTIKHHLRRKHGNVTTFGVVSFWHIRKGLDKLVDAVNILSKKRNDFKVHLITDRSTFMHVKPSKELYIDTVFGQRSRLEVLAFLGAVDYLIVPSLAEGFCLPLLEANAMGTPVVHCLYPPLTEISDPTTNLTFDYGDLQVIYTGEGIEFELHQYDPASLAEIMDRAIDMRKNDVDEYQKRCVKVKGVIDRFDAEVLYNKLVDYLK